MATDHLDLLLRLAPRGPLSYDDGTVARAELEAFASGLDDVWTWRDTLLDELLPDLASLTLEDWERVYDLHRTDGRSDATRRDSIIARVLRLPDFNPGGTLEPIYKAVALNLDLSIIEPGAFRCDDPDSLCDAPGDVLDGVFIFWVQLDAVEAAAASLEIDELQEAVDQTRPAHTLGIVRFEGFYCDDPYSVCDRDILGV